jgi:hypothetical protein
METFSPARLDVISDGVYRLATVTEVRSTERYAVRAGPRKHCVIT